MPYRNRTYRRRPRYAGRRYKKNNFYRGRKRKYNPRNRITSRKMSTLTGIPDSSLVKLKYTTFITLNSAVQAVHVFSGNSIFDPDRTGLGGQPLGHDQWANFYEKYSVGASKIKIQALNKSTIASTGNVLINLTPVDDNVSRAYDEWSAYPYNKNKFIAPVSAGQNGIYMNNYMSTRKINANNIDDDVYQASFGSNPPRS